MTICMYFVSACDLHWSACMCFVHLEPVSVCVCICVWLQGLCVRGVEHLNINNCHVGHLGPHSQLAPWAHSHHQHSCHRERERGEGNRNRERETGRKQATRKRETRTLMAIRGGDCTYTSGNRSERQKGRQMWAEEDLREASALHDNSPLFPLVDIFLLFLTAMCLILPAESSASGCHVLTLNQTIFFFSDEPSKWALSDMS